MHTLPNNIKQTDDFTKNTFEYVLQQYHTQNSLQAAAVQHAEQPQRAWHEHQKHSRIFQYLNLFFILQVSLSALKPGLAVPAKLVPACKKAWGNSLSHNSLLPFSSQKKKKIRQDKNFSYEQFKGSKYKVWEKSS